MTAPAAPTTAPRRTSDRLRGELLRAAIAQQTYDQARVRRDVQAAVWEAAWRRWRP